MKRTIDLTLEQYKDICKRSYEKEGVVLGISLKEEYAMYWYAVLNILNPDTEVGKKAIEKYMQRIEKLEQILIKGKSVSVPKWRLKELKELKKKSEENCVCSKCGGTGIIPAYSWNDNGICFKCKGTGKK